MARPYALGAIPNSIIEPFWNEILKGEAGTPDDFNWYITEGNYISWFKKYMSSNSDKNFFYRNGYIDSINRNWTLPSSWPIQSLLNFGKGTGKEGQVGILYAVGRFQMLAKPGYPIESSAEAAIKVGSIKDKNALFSYENQNLMGQFLIRSSAQKYIFGEVPDELSYLEDALFDLSMTWSSIGVPYRGAAKSGRVANSNLNAACFRGGSFYRGDGACKKKTVTPEMATEALRTLRKSLGFSIADQTELDKQKAEIESRGDNVAPITASSDVPCDPIFKDKKEADDFRIWLNDKYPDIAAAVPSLPDTQKDRKVDRSGKCDSPNLKAAAEYQVESKRLIDIFRADPANPPRQATQDPIAQNKKADDTPTQPKKPKRLNGQIYRVFKNTLKPKDVAINLFNEGDQQKALLAKSFGIVPMLIYGDVTIEPKDLKSFRLFHEGLVPKIEATIFDTFGIFKNSGKPGDDTKISLYIDSRSKQLRSIRMDFKIILFQSTVANTYTLHGILDVPKLYAKGQFASIPSSTSMSALQAIAKECGLGFCTNVLETNDAQTWVNTGSTYREFIKKIVDKSYISDESFQSCYIDYYYNLVFTDLTTEFKRQIDKDVMAVATGFDKITAGVGQTDIDDNKVEPLSLTTDRNLQVGMGFIEKFKTINNSTAISVAAGHRVEHKVVDVSKKEITYFKVQGQNDDPTKTKPFRANSGDDQYYNENTKSVYGGKLDSQDDGNSHPNLAYAFANNKVNFFEVIKFTATADMPNYNLNLYPYRKIPITVMMGAPTMDQPEGIDLNLSGNWLILSMEMQFRNFVPKMILTCAKRSTELLPNEQTEDLVADKNADNSKKSENPTDPVKNEDPTKKPLDTSPTGQTDKKPVRILFVGDSVTDMVARDTNGNPLKPPKATGNYPNIIKKKRPDLQIDQVAKGGWRTDQMLKGEKVSGNVSPVVVKGSYTATNCDELHAFQSTGGKVIGNMNALVGIALEDLYNKGVNPKVTNVKVSVSGMTVNWEVTINKSDDGKAWTGFTSRGAGCNNDVLNRAVSESDGNGPGAIKNAILAATFSFPTRKSDSEKLTTDFQYRVNNTELEVVNDFQYTEDQTLNPQGTENFRQVFYRYTKPEKFPAKSLEDRVGLEDTLKTTKWDRIYIYGGINDMFSQITVDQCLQNIQKMVDLSISNGAEPYVILGYKVDGFMKPEIMPTTIYVTTADAYKPYIERYKEFQGKLSTVIKNAKFVSIFNLDGLTSDGFHPNGKGSEIIANEIIKTLPASAPNVGPSITTDKADSDKKRLLFLGDSLSDGQHPVQIEQYFAAKAQSKSKYYQCIVDKCTGSGWTTPTMIGCMTPLLAKHKYDKIYIWGGLNELAVGGVVGYSPGYPKRIDCPQDPECKQYGAKRNGGPEYFKVRNWPPAGTPTDKDAKRKFFISNTKYYMDQALNNNQKVVDLGHKNGAKVYIIEGWKLGYGGCYVKETLEASYSSPFLPASDWENIGQFLVERYTEFRQKLPNFVKGADGFIKELECKSCSDGVHHTCGAQFTKKIIAETLSD